MTEPTPEGHAAPTAAELVRRLAAATDALEQALRDGTATLPRLDRHDARIAAMENTSDAWGMRLVALEARPAAEADTVAVPRVLVEALVEWQAIQWYSGEFHPEVDDGTNPGVDAHRTLTGVAGAIYDDLKAALATRSDAPLASAGGASAGAGGQPQDSTERHQHAPAARPAAVPEEVLAALEQLCGSLYGIGEKHWRAAQILRKWGTEQRKHPAATPLGTGGSVLHADGSVTLSAEDARRHRDPDHKDLTLDFGAVWVDYRAAMAAREAAEGGEDAR